MASTALANFAHHAVASAVEDATARTAHEIIEDKAIGFEPRESLFLVLGGDAGILRDIRRHDGRDLALQGLSHRFHGLLSGHQDSGSIAENCFQFDAGLAKAGCASRMLAYPAR